MLYQLSRNSRHWGAGGPSSVGKFLGEKSQTILKRLGTQMPHCNLADSRSRLSCQAGVLALALLSCGAFAQTSVSILSASIVSSEIGKGSRLPSRQSSNSWLHVDYRVAGQRASNIEAIPVGTDILQETVVVGRTTIAWPVLSDQMTMPRVSQPYWN